MLVALRELGQMTNRQSAKYLPAPKGCPAHLSERPKLIHLLRRWGNIVYAHYGVPVYLCGSALKPDAADPRDWDIRIRLSATSFLIRYGSPEEWENEGKTGFWSRTRWRWVDDCRKQSARGAKYTGLNIDFEVHPPSFWRRYSGEARLRLDTRGHSWT